MNAASDRVDEDSARAPVISQGFEATKETTHSPLIPPIPSYEAATGLAQPVIPAITSQDAPLADELPDYTPVDSNQTTSMIYGTFIHNPNGPDYHL
jgi:hypothetical protein